MLTLLLALGCADPRDDDRDGDGVVQPEDCNDADPTRHPGAWDPLGDEVDRNCDGVDGQDGDGDGFVDLAMGGDDCDDTRADVYPGAEDAPYDGVDADCAGDDDDDADDDGQAATSAGGTDCDDTDPEIHDGADEHCDGVDEDCDGVADDGASDAGRYYEDVDGDGFGDGAVVRACEIRDGLSESATDCDDADPAVYPGAPDTCGDGIESDCLETEPACGLWQDGEASDAFAVFEGTVEDDSVGWHATGGHDITGDGLPDLVVGIGQTTDGEQAVAVFAGPDFASAPVDDADVRIFRAGAPAYRDTSPVSLRGDLTGDGEPDLVFASPYGEGEGYSDGFVVLFAGPLAGDLDTDAADVRIDGTSDYYSGTNGDFGAFLGAPGDLTGDGVDDLVVGSGVDYPDTFVFAGPLEGAFVDADAYTHLEGSYPETGIDDMGPGQGVGDVDGDGVADLVVGTNAEALLFFGPMTEGAMSDTDADASFEEVSRTNLGCVADLSGDLDGDGSPEVVLAACGSFYAEGVYVYSGPFSGTVTSDTAVAELFGDGTNDRFGESFALLDLDGDTRSDLAIGAPAYQVGYDEVGGVALFYGPVSGRLEFPDADANLYGEAADDELGRGVDSVGDVDGDGFFDLVVGGIGGVGYATLWLGGPGT